MLDFLSQTIFYFIILFISFFILFFNREPNEDIVSIFLKEILQKHIIMFMIFGLLMEWMVMDGVTPRYSDEMRNFDKISSLIAFIVLGIGFPVVIFYPVENYMKEEDLKDLDKRLEHGAKWMSDKLIYVSAVFVGLLKFAPVFYSWLLFNNYL